MTHRKVKEKIHELMRAKGNLSKEYVVGLVKQLDDRPDTNKLEEQYYKAKADKILSSFKDENGIRDCFAIKDKQNKTKYVDISNFKEVKNEEVKTIKDRQVKLKLKKEEVIKKVMLVESVLNKQITVAEYESELKQQLIG